MVKISFNILKLYIFPLKYNYLYNLFFYFFYTNLLLFLILKQLNSVPILNKFKINHNNNFILNLPRYLFYFIYIKNFYLFIYNKYNWIKFFEIKKFYSINCINRKLFIFNFFFNKKKINIFKYFLFKNIKYLKYNFLKILISSLYFFLLINTYILNIIDFYFLLKHNLIYINKNQIQNIWYTLKSGDLLELNFLKFLFFYLFKLQIKKKLKINLIKIKKNSLIFLKILKKSNIFLNYINKQLELSFTGLGFIFLYTLKLKIFFLNFFFSIILFFFFPYYLWRIIT